MDRKELGIFFREEMISLAGDLPNRAALFHYTHPSRLLEILQSGATRAYCIEHMNDTAEVQYAASIARAHVDRACAIEPDERVVPLFQAMQRSMTERLQTSMVFVLSFSDDGDELGMWGLYANRRRGLSFALQIVDAANWAAANNGYLVRVHYDPSDSATRNR